MMVEALGSTTIQENSRLIFPLRKTRSITKKRKLRSLGKLILQMIMGVEIRGLKMTQMSQSLGGRIPKRTPI